jgi:hypothetical protein
MKIRSIAAGVALAVTLNALPALADGGSFALSKSQTDGAATGFAVGAGGTALYQYRKPIGEKLRTLRAKSGGHRIARTTPGMKPGQMKDAAGRLNRHTNQDYNRKYLDRFGSDHARAIDDAKREQAKTRRALKKKRAAERRQFRKLKQENPKAARKLARKRAAARKIHAIEKRKKTLRVLGDQTKKHSSNGRRYKKTSTKLLKARSTRKTLKTLKHAKRIRTAKKIGKIAAGGAAGMVAGAALGEDVPDVFDAAEYSVKLVKDPRNAPKMLANTAKGGVRMAGRMALTVTDPGKMARNLGGAAKGVGRSIANTGAYKKLARTKTGRTIGKGTRWAGRGVSKGYRTVSKTRTGRAIGSAARTVDKQVFKRANKGLRSAGKGLKKGGKALGRTAKKSTRKLKKTTRKIGKGLKKTTRKAGKTAKKVAKKLKFW